jgi:hypothetical protein
LKAASQFNAEGGYADYRDWRVPNIKELNSIVERRCVNPAINTAVFPNTPSGGTWSSSPSADASEYAWGVTFSYGHEAHGFKASSNSLRLVRGGQWCSDTHAVCHCPFDKPRTGIKDLVKIIFLKYTKDLPGF